MIASVNLMAMSDAEIIEMAQQSLMICIQLGAPILLVGLLVGVSVALIQALTQVQEITLVFVPKIMAIFLALFFFLPIMMHTLIAFTQGLAEKIVGG